MAKPFVKWVGGKDRLLKQYENFFPAGLKNGEIKNYIEPFLGGGAVFFYIMRKFKIKNAYLLDLNPDLILSYKVIQKKPDALLDYLRDYQKNYDKTQEDKRGELFLSIRKHFNETRFIINYKKFSEDWIPRAAELIFLNKTCFNGLFRLNSKGEYNVPFGKNKTPAICNEENILAVSNALRNAGILHADYKHCFNYVNDSSFVYFDPPYRPITKTSNFTAYTKNEFNDKQQIELAEFFKKLDKEKSAYLMLSNSDPVNINPRDDFFKRAYSGYNMYKVSANRAVNSNGAKRGRISELLITNY